MRQTGIQAQSKGFRLPAPVEKPEDLQRSHRQGPDAGLGRAAVQAEDSADVGTEPVPILLQRVAAFNAVVKLGHQSGSLQQAKLEITQGKVRIRVSGDVVQGIQRQLVEGNVGLGLRPEAIHQLGQI